MIEVISLRYNGDTLQYLPGTPLFYSGLLVGYTTGSWTNVPVDSVTRALQIKTFHTAYGGLTYDVLSLPLDTFHTAYSGVTRGVDSAQIYSWSQGIIIRDPSSFSQPSDPSVNRSSASSWYIAGWGESWVHPAYPWVRSWYGQSPTTPPYGMLSGYRYNLVDDAGLLPISMDTFNGSAGIHSLHFTQGRGFNIGTISGLTDATPGTHSYTVFVVASLDSGASGSLLRKAIDTSPTLAQYDFYIGPPDIGGGDRVFYTRVGGIQSSGSILATGSPKIYTISVSNNKVYTYINNTVDIISGSIGIQTNSQPNQVGYNLEGQIAEIIVYNTVLSDSQRASVYNYLSSYYSI